MREESSQCVPIVSAALVFSVANTLRRMANVLLRDMTFFQGEEHSKGHVSPGSMNNKFACRFDGNSALDLRCCELQEVVYRRDAGRPIAVGRPCKAVIFDVFKDMCRPYVGLGPSSA